MLSDIPKPTDDRVLVDFRTSDDAGVYRWESGPALVQTVDFFTPIVDDPYSTADRRRKCSERRVRDGRSPADGARHRGVSERGTRHAHDSRDLPRRLRQVARSRRGLLGGHTVQDQEIKFGYAVTGEIDPDARLTNSGARPGDFFFLTKPIGTGIIATAIEV